MHFELQSNQSFHQFSTDILRPEAYERCLSIKRK